MSYLLQQLLSDSASKYPERPAVLFKDETLTYAELEQDSNALASTLHGYGIGQGDQVAIFLGRGIASIIALFGVLKAGATYVPIDPAAPPNRFRHIVDTCRIRCILTSRERLRFLEQEVANGARISHIVVMDGLSRAANSAVPLSVADWHMLRTAGTSGPPAIQTTDSDLAFVLFTSGSTGQPKGVMLSHMNALTFVRSAREVFRVSADDRLSNICPLHFDMSVFDLFVAFQAGAAVVVVPEIAAVFPVKIAEAIVQHRITVWNSVPSALALLATHADLAQYDLSSLRLVLFAGEPFPLKQLRLLQNALPQARFCNMYGQTEANSSTYHWVDPVREGSTVSIPIGKPLPNFDVFAVDDSGGRITQAGEIGELYVRSSSVARGYWADQERSEKVFVSNPLRPEINERVYRTGDLVRMDSDGNWVFVARKDHMIKSRGYRIEIGEIEAILGAHPAVKHVVVVPVPDELIGNRISVVIVPSAPGMLGTEDVLRYCMDRLPKYMVPETVEFRDSLPTTSSGKVDRKQLVKPEARVPSSLMVATRAEPGP